MATRTANETVEYWFHSPGPVERSLGLWVAKAGVTQTTPEYRAGPRVISFYSLHVLLSGSLTLSSGHEGKQRQVLNAGDVFCLFPGTPYWYRPYGDQPPRMLWLAIDGPAAGGVIENLRLTRSMPIMRGLRVRPFVAHLPALRAVSTDSDSRGLLAMEYMTRIIGEIIGQTDQHLPRQAGGGWLERGVELFDAHFASGITVAEVAERLGVDRTHFSKAFSRSTGHSPAEYLRARRLDAGRHMLRDSTLSVAEIALSVGYGDVCAFSHSYRDHFGVNPSSDRLTRQP